MVLPPPHLCLAIALGVVLSGCSGNVSDDAADPSDTVASGVAAEDVGGLPLGIHDETVTYPSKARPATGPASEWVEIYNLTATISGATVFEDTFDAPEGTTELSFDVQHGFPTLCAGVMRLAVLDSAGNEVAAGNWDCAPLGGVGCVVHVTCQLRGFDVTQGTYSVVYDVVGVVHVDVHAHAHLE